VRRGKKKKAVVLPLLNMFLSCTFSFALALHVQTMCFLLSPIICLRLDTCLPVPTFLFPSLPADYLCANAMITTWFVSLSTIIAGIGVQN